MYSKKTALVQSGPKTQFVSFILLMHLLPGMASPVDILWVFSKYCRCGGCGEKQEQMKTWITSTQRKRESNQVIFVVKDLCFHFLPHRSGPIW